MRNEITFLKTEERWWSQAAEIWAQSRLKGTTHIYIKSIKKAPSYNYKKALSTKLIMSEANRFSSTSMYSYDHQYR